MASGNHTAKTESREFETGEGIRTLIGAVLLKTVPSRDGLGETSDRVRLATEALRWVVSGDPRSLFPFQSVCEILGVKAAYLRRRLVRQATPLPAEDGVSPYDVVVECASTPIPPAALEEFGSANPLGDHGPDCGARALLRAVLQEAILCLTGEGVPKRERARVAAEARRWMLSKSTRWLFAFQTICDVLDIDADVVRNRFLRDRVSSDHELEGGRTTVRALERHGVVGQVRQMRLRGNLRHGLLHEPLRGRRRAISSRPTAPDAKK